MRHSESQLYTFWIKENASLRVLSKVGLHNYVTHIDLRKVIRRHVDMDWQSESLHGIRIRHAGIQWIQIIVGMILHPFLLSWLLCFAGFRRCGWSWWISYLKMTGLSRSELPPQRPPLLMNLSHAARSDVCLRPSRAAYVLRTPSALVLPCVFHRAYAQAYSILSCMSFVSWILQ